jgi:hypothetical protein
MATISFKKKSSMAYTPHPLIEILHVCRIHRYPKSCLKFGTYKHDFLFFEVKSSVELGLVIIQAYFCLLELISCERSDCLTEARSQSGALVRGRAVLIFASTPSESDTSRA